MKKVQRALISVFDKTGILPFAKALDSLGVHIISTGGTADLLRKEGIAVEDISSVTEFPEMLDGRVKTLHPKVHAGLLAVRDNSAHMQTLQKHSIQTIDLVVVNLYPFWDAVKNKTREEDIIEMIDIGGPAMLRSASKNFRDVAVVSDPADYEKVIQELKNNHLKLQDGTLKSLAAKAFKLTSSYDALIADYFLRGQNFAEKTEGLPPSYNTAYEKVSDLRYGENPHQKGALYKEKNKSSSGVVSAKQLHGKELSFNNILDLDAAWQMATAFEEPACSIVKHTSPCGFSVTTDLNSAFKKAYACDPLSAFGGIIAFNGQVDAKTAQSILKAGFFECVIATGFDSAALTALKAKKNLRLLALSNKNSAEKLDLKKVSGGLLIQDTDELDPKPEDLKCVTKLKPTKPQVEDLLFAFKVCRYVKSNAIVVAKKGACLGMGMGQPSRVDSCDVAFKKAGKKAKGAVLASDGFFPKPDSIALAKKFGIKAIIQPGGSIQDEAVIDACNKAKISMIFTGIRHFKH